MANRTGENGRGHFVAPANPQSPSALDERDPMKRWGPYLADRQWGTVREDYSEDGNAWDFFTHDQARSRAYRWGEDGLLGISDDQGYLCFALSLWNEADPILKERLFGLTNSEGNHGEDVKEAYFYLDNTPDHSYMKALYKYPQRAFPYAPLVDENQRRGVDAPEYELHDTGIFDESRYFDVTVEYAKAAGEDILIRVTAVNRGPEPAPLHLLPSLWFRNTWSWGHDDRKPSIQSLTDAEPDHPRLHANHWILGDYWLDCQGSPEILMTENESNCERLWGTPNPSRYVKDGINDAVVADRADSVNPDGTGTRAAAHYAFTLEPGESRSVVLRLSHRRHRDPFADADMVFDRRIEQADELFARIAGDLVDEDERNVQRQALAGLLWSKQFYYYDVSEWLAGDPAGPHPPESRRTGRNANWRHVNCAEVLSMPDAWEYPWFAAWDLAFHCVALARVDPAFAKRQILLLLRDWYMHPNGQLPAYEWAFEDVNPPVHAWAALQVYQAEQSQTGNGDRQFLERVFHKLLLNFTWWVNRKDSRGRNVFQGGFLGLDNIGVFDRSSALPTGGDLEQSDATAWMGMFSLNMMSISLELARENHAYEGVATKFFDHFLYIAAALNDLGGTGIDIWDEEDGFFYDVLMWPDGTPQPLRIRSLVGIIPLLAVTTLEPDLHHTVPGFEKRMRWFLSNRPDLADLVPSWFEEGKGKRRLLSLVHGHRMKRVLNRMLDPERFLSDYGVRSLSKIHQSEPFEFNVDGGTYSVHYEPAESHSGMFGGNSNWRGPIWFPINYLIVESLRRYHHYYGDDFLVECPVGTGNMMTLNEVADEVSRRLVSVFLRGDDGRRPVFGANDMAQYDPHWEDHLLFYEYFHGDNGAGIGASHQTGWTALVATLIEDLAHSRMQPAAQGRQS